MATTNQRSPQKRIRVTYPDGSSICCRHAVHTIIKVLQKVGPERFSEINIQVSHRPLISQRYYYRLKEYMVPICDGWYFNNMSVFENKLDQIREINRQLNLGLVIEHGDHLKVTDNYDVERKVESRHVKVTFSDGEVAEYKSPRNVLLHCVYKLGVEKIAKREILWHDRPLLTYAKLYRNQEQVDQSRWINIPQTVKETYVLLNYVQNFIGDSFNVELVA